MIELLTLLGIVLGPFAVMSGVLRAMRGLAERCHGGRPRSPRSPAPPRTSLGRLVDERARLEREYERLERSVEPSRERQLHAVALAYDEVLRSCCAALDLEAPATLPFDGLERLEVQAALAQRGLSW